MHTNFSVLYITRSTKALDRPKRPNCCSARERERERTSTGRGSCEPRFLEGYLSPFGFSSFCRNRPAELRGTAAAAVAILSPPEIICTPSWIMPFSGRLVYRYKPLVPSPFSMRGWEAGGRLFYWDGGGVI